MHYCTDRQYSVRTITVSIGSFTGDLSGIVPGSDGAHIGSYGGFSLAEFVAPNGAHIEFTVVGTYSKASIVNIHTSAQFELKISDSFFEPNMTLKVAGLYRGATLVAASDEHIASQRKS